MSTIAELEKNVMDTLAAFSLAKQRYTEKKVKLRAGDMVTGWDSAHPDRVGIYLSSECLIKDAPDASGAQYAEVRSCIRPVKTDGSPSTILRYITYVDENSLKIAR